jgi:hypothetical protein
VIQAFAVGRDDGKGSRGVQVKQYCIILTEGDVRFFCADKFYGKKKEEFK